MVVIVIVIDDDTVEIVELSCRGCHDMSLEYCILYTVYCIRSFVSSFLWSLCGKEERE